MKNEINSVFVREIHFGYCDGRSRLIKNIFFIRFFFNSFNLADEDKEEGTDNMFVTYIASLLSNHKSLHFRI